MKKINDMKSALVNLGKSVVNTTILVAVGYFIFVLAHLISELF